MRNINVVNKIVANELKIDEKLVEKINKAYWGEIRKNLSTISESPIHIKKIGTIDSSPYKTNKHILSLIRKLRRVEASQKYIEANKLKIIGELREDLKNLLIKRNQHATYLYKKKNK